MDRVRAADRRLVDGLVALALVTTLQLQLVLGEHPGSLPVNVVGGLLLTVPLVWRRSSPLAVALVFAASDVTQQILGGDLFAGPPPPFASLVAGAATFYSLGAHAEDRPAAVGAVIGVAGLWTSIFLSGEVDTQSFVFSAGLVVTAPWLAGRVTRAHNLRAAALEREQEQRARLAVSDERRRIARDFHDVVAHSVGVMVTLADGAGRILERDPGRARDALDSIGTTGRAALSELERSLGVLRHGEGGALTPQPGIDDLGALIEQAREAGLRVAVVVEGDPRSLPQGVDLAGYRIVQEALTNTIKHAGAVDTRVTIRYGERELGLEVSDDGPDSSGNGSGAGSGHGLAGMRERVTLYEGEFRAGPGREGGFLVHARIPLTK
jgi:signal transduction histidine kinase